MKKRHVIPALLSTITPSMVCAQTAPSPPPAKASEATGGEGIEDIVVTAQRREERLQDIPISVTAIGGDQLRAGSINSTVDLGTVTPGLIMGNGAVSLMRTRLSPIDPGL